MVINKIDLLDKAPPDEVEHFKDALKAYEQAQIPIIRSSIITGEGIEEIRRVMIDKASVFQASLEWASPLSLTL